MALKTNNLMMKNSYEDVNNTLFVRSTNQT